MLTGSSTIVCNLNGEWSASPTCAATTTMTTTTVPTTTTEDNGGWQLIFRQKECLMSTAQALSINPRNPDADCFSLLIELEEYKLNDKFTFKMSYPDLGERRGSVRCYPRPPLATNVP
jgi:hypothetical protein